MILKLRDVSGQRMRREKGSDWKMRGHEGKAARSTTGSRTQQAYQAQVGVSIRENSRVPPLSHHHPGCRTKKHVGRLLPKNPRPSQRKLP